ncbi:hypothetical protein CAFE_03140 [Caprobacter fermentans]|uniref:Uncharacterized protein n=1 Tax=Caproicibacter fermentans TaxID=2576756 RepID=A0A6N8HVB6_9FIRM|nr:hypothetical protein [Caproicibacter fermentans]
MLAPAEAGHSCTLKSLAVGRNFPFHTSLRFQHIYGTETAPECRQFCLQFSRVVYLPYVGCQNATRGHTGGNARLEKQGALRSAYGVYGCVRQIWHRLRYRFYPPLPYLPTATRVISMNFSLRLRLKEHRQPSSDSCPWCFISFLLSTAG